MQKTMFCSVTAEDTCCTCLFLLLLLLLLVVVLLLLMMMMMMMLLLLLLLLLFSNCSMLLKLVRYLKSDVFHERGGARNHFCKSQDHKCRTHRHGKKKGFRVHNSSSRGYELRGAWKLEHSKKKPYSFLIVKAKKITEILHNLYLRRDSHRR